MDWSAVIGAALASAAVAYTAFNARRAKEKDLLYQRQADSKPDWSSYSQSMSSRLAQQDKSITELDARIDDMRRDIARERELSMSAIKYLRTIFDWLRPLVPSGQSPPKPPDAIMDELAAWMVGYDE